MKKVLLATTALVLSAGYAAAEAHSGISLSGSANGGLKYNSEAEGDEISIHNEVNMVITGVGVSDAGLEFGAFIDIDEDSVDDAEVFISGTFGTLTVGDVDPATDGFGIADVGFDGIGMDDPAEALKNALSSAEIVYSYSAAGLTFTASTSLSDDDYAAAVEYATDMFSVGLGYAFNDSFETEDGLSLDEFDLPGTDISIGNNSTVTIVAGIDQGPFSANAIYSMWNAEDVVVDTEDLGDVDATAYGIDVSFDTGAATITGVYSNLSFEGERALSTYGIGARVPLGGGLAVAGGVGVIDVEGADNATVADLGVTMSF